MRPIVLILVASLCATLAHSQPVLLTIPAPDPDEQGGFGDALVAVDDLDRDGLEDILVGAPGEARSGAPPKSGAAYVVSSQTGQLLIKMASPRPREDGAFGQAVGRLSDLDGDGISDYVIGAQYERSDDGLERAGAAYVFSGSTGRLMHSLYSPNPQAYGYFGGAVADAGDLDRDGISEILVSAFTERSPGISETNPGRVYLISGKTGNLLRSLVSPHEQTNGYFGRAVCGLGDVDGDGTPDFAIGADGEDHGPFKDNGITYIISGSTSQTLHELRSPNAQTFGYFGRQVSPAGDIDLDGLMDIVVSAPLESNGVSTLGGMVYTFSSATGELLHQLVSPEQEHARYFGLAAASAGDIDGDGYPDVVIGAPQDGDPESPDRDGRAYVYSGFNGVLLTAFVSPAPEFGSRFGSSVTGLSYVNGGGLAGIVVGAPYETLPSVGLHAGHVYVLPSMSVATTPAPASLPTTQHMSLAPNPASSVVRLTFSPNTSAEARLSVHDVLGREVAVLADGARPAGETTLVLDVSGWAPGVYLVRLATTDGVRTTRLTVAR